MRKKVLALVLSAAMIGGLAACGSSSTSGSTTAATESTASADTETASNESADMASTATETPTSGDELSVTGKEVDTSNAQYHFSLGHTNAETDSWQTGALAFKQYAEEKSNGQIAIDVYPNSQLGSEIDMIQSILQQSGCDIIFTGESMQTYEPDLGMIGMPYLIQTEDQMYKVLDGDVGKEFEGLMENAGMECLGYFVRGPRYITSNKKISSVADMKNLIIRTPQSPMTVAAFTATGAKPTPMALSEVFTSLQQGTIEAEENPIAMIQTQSFYEVQKYLIETAHLRAWVYIAMGKQQFDSLPEDLQKVVREAGQYAQQEEHKQFVKNEEEYTQQLKDEGMEFIEVDQDEFAKAMIDGVLPTLTDSQKKLYDEIEALK
jgi:tripartite ATP-independent transporter DctP family solute receptor